MAHARDRWSNRGAFIFAAIGSAIGLGNLWRFPFTAYDGGGGAFLIPYFVALITTGVPLLILEMGTGQYFQGGAPWALRKMNRKAEWVGWWALAGAAIITFYYCVIMGWSFIYFFHALNSALTGAAMPWAGGDGAAGAFFDSVLQVDGSLFFLPGPPIIWIVLGLAATWWLVYLIICKGVIRVGKVVMWTVPLPFIILIMLAISGFQLEGAANGLAFYLNPDMNRLSDPQVWLSAFGQVFFSLSVGFGVMTAYGSYLSKRTELTGSAWITALANCGTSFFAGFAVFATLGYLASQQGAVVSDVLKGGPGFVFVIYPEALSMLPFGDVMNALIAALLFACLLMLGIDSAFSIVEGVVTGLHDKFRIKRERLVRYYCYVGFIIGLLFCTPAGLTWLDIVDRWVNYIILVIGLGTCIVAGWFYPLDKIKAHINSVSLFKVGTLWTFAIRFFIPIVLAVIFTMAMIDNVMTPYSGYKMSWLLVGGWGAFFAALVIAFVIASMPSKKYADRDEAEGDDVPDEDEIEQRNRELIEAGRSPAE
jgi:NSS family neurotransmitter:Na+ symporter